MEYPPEDRTGGERHDPGTSPVSRRDLLKHGTAAVVGGGAAAMLGGGSAFAQAPAVSTGRPSSAGRKFRAYVRHDATSSMMDLTLRPIQPRQVLVRVQASQACYSIINAITNVPVMVPAVVGHGAVGIVEEIGSQVKRVQVGDRVVVVVTSQCGQCDNCLRGKADRCQARAGDPPVPVATMADGTPVNGNLGGFAELEVAWEEQVVPVFTSVSASELSLLSCVTTTGLGLAMMRVPVEPGADVVVLGCGPVGLSAVQGARIMGAAQIIAVEPIRDRRDLALKLGATSVLDPNVEGEGLVNKIKDMCKGVTDRKFAGGRDWVNVNNKGPEFVLEAVGGDRFPPKVERGPDPTGVLPLQQAWQMVRAGGWIRTSGVGHPMGATVTFPAGAWSNGTKNQAGGNFAGVQTMRDVPRFIRLMETGQFDAKSLVGQTFPLERTRDALQAAADRTTISSIVTV